MWARRLGRYEPVRQGCYGPRDGCGLVPREVPNPPEGGLLRGGLVSPAVGGARPRTGSGRRVRGQVALEQRAVREDLAAGGAGRALGPVRAHVHVERALLREALGADSALEGAHACVRDHMLQQVVAQRERSPAHGTLVGLLPCGRQGTPRTYVSWEGASTPTLPLTPGPSCPTGTPPPNMTQYVSPLSGDAPFPDPYRHTGIPLSGPPTLTGTLPTGNPTALGYRCPLGLTSEVSPHPPLLLCPWSIVSSCSLATILRTVWQGPVGLHWEGRRHTCPLPTGSPCCPEPLSAGSYNVPGVTAQAVLAFKVIRY